MLCPQSLLCFRLFQLSASPVEDKGCTERLRVGVGLGEGPCGLMRLRGVGQDESGNGWASRPVSNPRGTEKLEEFTCEGMACYTTEHLKNFHRDSEILSSVWDLKEYCN